MDRIIKKNTQEKVNYENVDFLTSLYNRKYYLERLVELIKENQEFSVFVIDLNKFKLVNDVYGHDVGDVVLIEVGKRFQSLEREDVFFARFGGDEFAAIYETVDENKINALGEMIDDVLARHIVVSESEFTISASIGVSRFPMDADNEVDLLKLADMAMYHVKKSEIAGSYLISEELNHKLAKRRKIEHLLREIDFENDLFLEYQPIFDLKTKKLTGMEALVRWRHETEGTIYPLDFVYVAEEIDVVKEITRWVFIHALNQIKEWNETYKTNLQVSLNVSDNCIHNKIFFGNLQFMLKEFKVNPAWVALELSERSLLVSPEYMKNLLVSIDELGIDINIHNFGTNALMISDLKNFRIKTIKIDKSYVHELSNTKNKDNMSIVNSMILLAHGLSLIPAAEGIETEEQYEILKHYNCHSFQGFYMEKPLSKEAFEDKYLK